MTAYQGAPGTVVHAGPGDPPPFAEQLVNLASEGLGAQVLHATDEFFAPAQRMLTDASPVFVVGKFDDHGKWMDGWETRRKRGAGHDTAVLRLAMPGVVEGVDLDTSHFTGNFPPAASIEACRCEGDPDARTVWREIVPPQALSGNAHHFVAIADPGRWTHLRLNIFPDGGIARLRVYGRPVCEWSRKDPLVAHEVSALALGGRIVAVSDAHYGLPFRLLMPGRGSDMGDGWETRRRREPGQDWCIVQLGHRALVETIEVDTAHFKGNYPDRISMQAADVPTLPDASVVTQAMFWPVLLAEQKADMDKQHLYDQASILPLGPVTHVKLNLIPDGGVSRLRVWGRLAPAGAATEAHALADYDYAAASSNSRAAGRSDEVLFALGRSDGKNILHPGDDTCTY